MRTQAPAIAAGRVVVALISGLECRCAPWWMGTASIRRVVVHRIGRIAYGDPARIAGLRGDPVAAAAKGWTIDHVEHFLYHDCGLQAIRRIQRHPRAAGSEARLAKLAVDYFVYHTARTAGALAVSMGGIDGIVFTAGIGEHGVPVRARVLERLGWLGFEVDEAANARGAGRITGVGSRIPAFVIPTDEERVIARDTMALIGG